jgi:hypothetical protein
VHIIKARL